MGMFTIIITITILSFIGMASNVVHGNLLPYPHAVITIKTEKGQIYDCIDFFKQPAFNNPLVKKTIPKVRTKLASLQGRKIEGVGLRGEGCPLGTVPILRIAGRHNLTFTPLYKIPDHCTAAIRTRADDPNKKFLGSDAELSLHKPRVQNNQWSTTHIKLLNGGESIETGWMVNPDLFKDGEAHLYVKSIIAGKECINLECSGFVQVSTKVPLGDTPGKYSIIRGRQVGWRISIEKIKDDDAWWLIFGDEGVPIGYWPKTLFKDIADIAAQVEWGGEIHNPAKIYPPPEMGNGLLAMYDTAYSASLRQVTIVDQGFQKVNPGEDTEKYKTCEIYTVKDADYQGPEWGRLMFYGGYTSPY